MNRKKKIIYIAICVSLLGTWYFVDHQTNPGVTEKKLRQSNNKFRLLYLNDVYKSVLKYIRSTHRTPHSLFNVFKHLYSKNNIFPFNIKVYGFDPVPYGNEIIKSEVSFNNEVEYKLVRINQKGGWGVMELKRGLSDKYVFLITQDGSVYRILLEKKIIQTIKEKQWPLVPLNILRRTFQADQKFYIPQRLAKGEFKHINYNHRIIINNE